MKTLETITPETVPLRPPDPFRARCTHEGCWMAVTPLTAKYRDSVQPVAEGHVRDNGHTVVIEAVEEIDAANSAPFVQHLP